MDAANQQTSAAAAHAECTERRSVPARISGVSVIIPKKPNTVPRTTKPCAACLRLKKDGEASAGTVRSNGEAERPRAGARLEPWAHTALPRPRRSYRASRTAPAIVRRQYSRSETEVAVFVYFNLGRINFEADVTRTFRQAVPTV